MFILSSLTQENIFFNQWIDLVILCYLYIIYQTFIESIDQEQKTCIQCRIIVNSTSIINLNVPIIVYISNPAYHCKVFCHCAIWNFHLTTILNVEGSAFVGIVPKDGTIEEIYINFLIISKYDSSSSNRVILRKDGVISIENGICC